MKATTKQTEKIELDRIRIDGGTQSRLHLNQITINEYADAMTKGATLPEVMVFFDGEQYWLADGFHRYQARRMMGSLTIAAEVREGDKRAAILYSVAANIVHGLRRTNEDKRQAVSMLLDDVEWARWADRAIAKTCGVSHNFVSEIRKSICHPMTDAKASATRTVVRNGTPYLQDTTNIGSAAPTAEPQNAAPELSESVTVAVERDGSAPEADSPPSVKKTVLPKAEKEPGAENAKLRAENIKLSAELARLRADYDERDAHWKKVEVDAFQTQADYEMMGRTLDAHSDDQVKTAMDEAVRQKAIADAATASFNAQQGKVIALTEQVKFWQRRAEKAEKALKGGA